MRVEAEADAVQLVGFSLIECTAEVAAVFPCVPGLLANVTLVVKWYFCHVFDFF